MSMQITVTADESMPPDLRQALERWAATMNEFWQLAETLAEIADAAESHMEGAGQPEFGNYAGIANAARAALARRKSR